MKYLIYQKKEINGKYTEWELIQTVASKIKAYEFKESGCFLYNTIWSTGFLWEVSDNRERSQYKIVKQNGKFLAYNRDEFIRLKKKEDKKHLIRKD